MRMSQAFASKYLNAADLQNGRYTVTIARVEMGEMGDNEPDKPVVYFQGAEKGMVLNKTNGLGLAQMFGDDTDQWIGQRIEIYTVPLLVDGKSVQGIRVMAVPQAMPAHQAGPLGGGLPAGVPPGRPVHPAPNAPLPGQPQGGGSYNPGGDIIDEIPFGPCIY